MIAFLKSWCEGIIVAVILSLMIETILPEGNNKKYVKVVIGIYLIFTILNPLLGKLNPEIEFKSNFDLPSIETSTKPNTQNIQELYTNGIKETLKNKIEEEFQVKVEKLVISYDETYENIENISLTIQPSGVSEIEKVVIGNETQPEPTKQNYEPIKQYIAENYEVDKSKITIQ